MNKKPSISNPSPDDVAHCQISTNFHWLLARMDGVHAALCPSQNGTWQERAIQAETVAHKMKDAVKPFIHFIDQFDRKPLAKLDDQFYGIHNGTEFEANLKLSELRRLRDVCKSVFPLQMAVRINGKAVALEGQDRFFLGYNRIVELANTTWGTEATHTVTYRHKDGRSGILNPCNSISPSPAMVIDAMVCGDA